MHARVYCHHDVALRGDSYTGVRACVRACVEQSMHAFLMGILPVPATMLLPSGVTATPVCVHVCVRALSNVCMHFSWVCCLIPATMMLPSGVTATPVSPRPIIMSAFVVTELSAGLNICEVVQAGHSPYI
jgi:hypothetical protein